MFSRTCQACRLTAQKTASRFIRQQAASFPNSIRHVSSDAAKARVPRQIPGRPKARFVGLAAIFIVSSALTAVYYERKVQVSTKSPKSSNSTQSIQLTESTQTLDGMTELSYDTSDENIHAAIQEFTSLLGHERVDTEVANRVARSSTEWSAAPRGDLDRPAVIVYPRTTEETSAIAKTCHKRRIPMIGFSGGTSLEGTLAATNGGVSIDFKLMDKIVSLNKDDVDVVVQPGVGYMELNETLAKEGLFFPPDPGPGAKIGGMISQGCSGTNAFRYGTVKDWVLGLTVVLADGTIIKTRGRPRKSSSGYNLTQLMIGSEGTLGFITEASLKLTSVPRNERVGVATFPSVHAAVATAVKVVQSGMPVGAMELLDEMNMRAVNAGGYCDKEYDEVPTLFFKFHGDTPRSVQEQIEGVKALAREARSQSFEVSKTDEEAASIWQARKTILWSTLALKEDPSDKFLSSDTAVPIGRLGDGIEAAKKVAAESGLMCMFIGHVGDGNFHTSVLYPASEEEKARKVITAIQRKAIELDGTITGEHGVGLEYRDMVVEELGPGAVDAMRQIKLALDPLCLLNPDKLLRVKIKGQSAQK